MLLTTPGILEFFEPEERGADLELPLHDTPLPDKGTEPPTDHLPEQIRAPIDEEGPSESVWSEEPRRAMGQTSPAPTRAPRARRPSEGRMAGLLTSPTRKRRAPPLGSRNLSTRRASAKPTRRCNATRTRANTNPVGRRESRHARPSCPLGKDPALGACWRANHQVERAY